MTGTVRVEAQAKINLRLKVLGRDDSGYHAIETVFLRLELADRITVAVREGGGIELDVTGDDSLVVASGPADQNLALVAARAFARRSGWHPRIEIGIEKLIPVGAGLGGGSADAAAVLRALNALAPSPLPTPDLLSLAATIGSDVPFLVTTDVVALGWGRGERMRPLAPLPVRPVILAVPPVHVATRDAYAWLGRPRSGSPGDPVLPADAFTSWERAAALAENDFSTVVAERHPVTLAMQAALIARGARIAMLTGSGSTVFAVFGAGDSCGQNGNAGEWREIRTSTAAHVVPVRRMD